MEKLAIFIGISILISIAIIIHDNYRYPICEKCGTNVNTKRTKRETTCKVHGKIN